MAEKTMKEIEDLTKTFSQARDNLRRELVTIEGAIRRIKESRLDRLRELVSDANNAHDDLNIAITESPGLFKSPRTRTMHGIKAGLQKSTGSLKFASEEKVIELIRKHFPDKEDLLINTKETVVKKPLGKLPADDLKKIGVAVIPGKDCVLIKPADSDIDKWIDALMADEEPAVPAKAVA